MGTEHGFSMDQLFDIKDTEQKVQYLLMSHQDDESLNQCIIEMVCNDKYWSPEIEQNNTRFAFALKAELDKHDYPTFKEIFKKFLMTGIMGYCIPTNQLTSALVARNEHWISVYIPVREGMKAKRTTLRKPQINMLLKRFCLHELEFKATIDLLCQYLLSVKWHEQNKRMPHPNTVIPHWKCPGIHHCYPRQLVSFVSPYLTIEELSVFEQKMNGVYKEALPSMV